MLLRDYQHGAIDRVRRAMQGGARRVCLVIPTGGGKTVIFTEIVRRAVSAGRRALVLAHRAELVEQAYATLARAGLTVGAMCASAEAPPNPFAPVQVASVQTLLARRERPPADIIICDEAHHFAAGAEEFAALISDYPKAHVVGVTATPERGDGCGLRSCFDALVIGATVQELTDAGHLVPSEVMRPERALEPGQLARSPVDAYAEHAAGRPAIVFVRSVALAESYAQEFSMRGYQAHAISAETPWAERRMWIDAFRRGTVKVLTSVAVLTEGFDAPETSCVILARGCGSAGLYLQMIGRGLRPAPGKSDCVILDLRGVSHEHGKPEDERDYSLDGVGIRLRDPNSYCPVCGVARTPPAPCEACGYAPSGEDLAKPDKFTGDPLVKYAKLRAEADDARAKRLARWIADAERKGHKPGAWKHKFNAVYGMWPSKALELTARAAMQQGAA